MRFRLLPDNKAWGWTPYAWLIYLPVFFMEPIARWQGGNASALYLGANGLGLIVFLYTYFRAYWQPHDSNKLIAIAVLHVVLGAVFTPFNSGSSVFFVYGSSFGAQYSDRRVAKWLIAAFTLAAIATCLIVKPPNYFWITAIIFTPFIGAINLHFVHYGRTQVKLKLAHEEIERLATVAERERIARDMHDVLGHSLSLIVLKSELASKLADRDPARAAEEIRDVETVARKALQEVREAIRGYRPTVRDEVERAHAMLKAANINTHVDVADLQTDDARSEAIAFALREAVTNIVRHSNATKCSISLTQSAGRVSLKVSDNGKGSGSGSGSGSGIRGMRERLELLGGDVVIENGKGTILRVELPIA
ncbi:MAG TPA: sensor histidine kinase [Longimicrobiales bacterium]|nr:sensor histidine kinase [Longimicrobiales bacterium]